MPRTRWPGTWREARRCSDTSCSRCPSMLLCHMRSQDVLCIQEAGFERIRRSQRQQTGPSMGGRLVTVVGLPTPDEPDRVLRCGVTERDTSHPSRSWHDIGRCKSLPPSSGECCSRIARAHHAQATLPGASLPHSQPAGQQDFAREFAAAQQQSQQQTLGAAEHTTQMMENTK